MEKLADKIEHFLNQQMILYTSLDSLFEEEKKQIVDMNVDGLWNTVAQKKNIFNLLYKMNLDMKNLLELEAQQLGEENEPFKLSDLILKMPVPQKIKKNLKQVKLGVEACKKKVYSAAMANKQYVQESIIVINDIFSLVGQDSNEKKYSRSGQVMDNNISTRLINTEV
jgi:flagellar FlgN protein